MLALHRSVAIVCCLTSFGTLYSAQGQALQTGRKKAEALLEAGLQSAEKGDTVGAISHFREAIGLNPDFAEAWFNLGVAYSSQEKRSEGHGDAVRATVFRQQAIEAFERALLLDPNLPRIHEALGLLYQRRGEKMAAIQAFRKALARSPLSASSYNSLGSLLASVGSWEEATAAFEKAIELNPAFFLPHANLLRMIVERNGFTEAIAEAEKALLSQQCAMRTWVSC
jgi:tetratricopeptide (TPR) repeat protein